MCVYIVIEIYKTLSHLCHICPALCVILSHKKASNSKMFKPLPIFQMRKLRLRKVLFDPRA